MHLYDDRLFRNIDQGNILPSERQYRLQPEYNETTNQRKDQFTSKDR